MKNNVIFHVDETEKWTLALKNISNLLQLKNSNLIQIEVLANSEAVKGFILPQSPFDSDMRWLYAQGVTFVACNNALNALEINQKQLMPFVKVVPAGVLELIERQAEGYAYIKP